MTRPRATKNSWKTRPMPPQRKELELDGMFSRHEYVTVSLGKVPQSPADKWFIYLDGEWLYFHRAQTGACVFQLRIQPFEDRYHANLAVVNRNPQQYRNEDDEYDVAMIAYLIDHLLLGRFVPIPKPKGLRKQDVSQYKHDVMGADDDGRIDLGLINGRS